MRNMRLNIVLPIAAAVIAILGAAVYLSGEISGESYDASAAMVNEGNAELIAIARAAMKDSKVSRFEFLRLRSVSLEAAKGREVYPMKRDKGVGRETLRRAIARHGV